MQREGWGIRVDGPVPSTFHIERKMCCIITKNREHDGDDFIACCTDTSNCAVGSTAELKVAVKYGVESAA